MNCYKIKKLINGFRVSPLLKSRTLVAVPQNKVNTRYGFMPIQVVYKDEEMSITNTTPMLHQERFKDKYGRDNYYTLYYYEWLPNDNQTTLSI